MRVIIILSMFFVCTLTIVAQQSVEELGNLTEEIKETSGLIFYNNKLITHNDSGKTAQLFELDTTSLEVTRTITITNAINVDWEDITQDDTHIYVGDFGNFNGDRTDLTIYKIAKLQFLESISVTAEILEFSYENQTMFDANSNSDWDAEALFVLEDNLVILTKQWQSKGTVAYTIPKTTGVHIAIEIGKYAIDGLVTGASYNSNSGLLYLCGYSEALQPFLMKAENINLDAIFGDKQEKQNLSILFAQTEGITWVTDFRYYISSEAFSNSNVPIAVDSKLFAFNVENVEQEEEPSPNNEEQEVEKDKLIIYRVANTSILEYDLAIEGAFFASAIYSISGSQVYFLTTDEIKTNTIDLSTFQNGVYYLTFYYNKGIISKSFIWQ